MMVGGLVRARADDRLLHAGAFNWTYTLGTGLMDPWAAGATALIPAAGRAPAALPLLLAAPRRHDLRRRARASTGRCCAPACRRCRRLRHGLSAGEKLPETLRDALARRPPAPTVHEAFGMSECSTFVSGSPGAARARGHARPSAARPAHRGPRATARRCPAASPARIAVHRADPGLMLGYLDQPEETAARLRGDWFLTGDVAAHGRATAPRLRRAAPTT